MFDFLKREPGIKQLSERIDQLEKDILAEKGVSYQYAIWLDDEKVKSRAEKRKLLSDIDRLLSENSRLAHELVSLKTKEVENV